MRVPLARNLSELNDNQLSGSLPASFSSLTGVFDLCVFCVFAASLRLALESLLFVVLTRLYGPLRAANLPTADSAGPFRHF